MKLKKERMKLEKTKIIDVKEIKLRPNIDNNDFIVKMKQVKNSLKMVIK